MIKRILVGLGDLPHSASATQHAVELALQFGAELTAVTVVDLKRLEYVGSVPIGGGEAAHELREHRLQLTAEIIRQAVAEFEAQAKKAGLTYRVLHAEGEPYDAIIDASRYHDLMVFGLGHLFEHGVVEEPPDELIQLVRAGVRPILAVASQHRPIHRVLLAYSGSMESAKTMRRYVQLGLWPDAQLRIVTFGHARDEAARLLEDAAAYCRRHGLKPETELRAESPRGNLVAYAREWDTDLLVLGNSARTLLMQRLLGDTAMEVIRQWDRCLFLSQ